MANVFGEHRPKIPYQPVADLLAHYRQRDPDKLAIVDLDQETFISFGGLDRAVTDIAAALKRAGVGKGSRVLLLSNENLEKLLIWLAVWRLGAVVAPLNIELNATLIADLATAVSPSSRHQRSSCKRTRWPAWRGRCQPRSPSAEKRL